MKTRTSLAILILAVVGTLVLAARPVAAAQPELELGHAWPRIIAALKARGLERIGDLKLDDFEREARQVKWEVNPHRPPGRIAGNRRSAYYRTEGKRVFVSPRPEGVPDEMWAQLELHEAMGALGLNDGNYALSTALALIAATDDNETRVRLQSEFGKTLFRRQHFAGGSSVSGGGDVNALIVKQAVLARLQSRPETLGPDLLEEFPHVNFEPIYVADAGVALRFSVRGPQGIREQGSMPGALTSKGHQFLITVLVPMQAWERENGRAYITEDIAFRLRDIFPPLARGELEAKIPRGCGEWKDLSLLNEDIPFQMLTMITIRTTREWYRRGCGVMKHGSRSWGAGGVPFGGDTTDADHDFIECKVDLNGTKSTQQLKIARPAPWGHSSWTEPKAFGVATQVAITTSNRAKPLLLILSSEKPKKFDAKPADEMRIEFKQEEPFMAEGTFRGKPVSAACRTVDPREERR